MIASLETRNGELQYDVKLKQDEITLLRQEIAKVRAERGGESAVAADQATADVTTALGDHRKSSQTHDDII